MQQKTTGKTGHVGETVAVFVQDYLDFVIEISCI